jgi:hypothetical protein
MTKPTKIMTFNFFFQPENQKVAANLPHALSSYTTSSST